MPATFANEALFDSACEIAARAHQKGAAAHRGIEHAQTQNLVRASVANERLECSSHEERADRAWRVKGPTRLTDITRADQCRGAIPGWLILEDALVHGAELFHVQIGVGNPSSPDSGRPRTNGHHRVSHDGILDAGSIERSRLSGREEATIERRHLQLSSRTTRMGQPRDRLDRPPHASIPAS